jgi:long-chain acyl-CoA synthetase
MALRPWLAHYDEGVPQKIDYPSYPLFYFLEDSARRFPTLPCTIYQKGVITYQQMDALTDTMAAALAGLGVGKGDRVGILLPNTPQFVLSYFATLKAGGIIVAIDSRYTPTEIIRTINDSGIKVLVFSSERYPEIKADLSQTTIQTFIVTDLSDVLTQNPSMPTEVEEKEQKTIKNKKFFLGSGDIWLMDLLVRYGRENRPVREINQGDVAIFQYTGGTTGTSKAALATHRNLVVNTLQFKYWLPSLQESREVILVAIPLFHVYGMVLGMLLGISMGAPLVLVPNARDLVDLLENIQEYQPTLFPGVPLLYHALSKHPDVKTGKYSLRSLKVCISGSAPLLPGTKESFEALSGGKILEGYGLSEAPTATHCNPQHGMNKVGSIGMPLPDVDARVINLDDGETEMKIGGIGELIISSPQIMQGYHNRPEETAHTLRKMKDGKVWLFTGDVVRMDEDGYFFIVDRVKELIKPGGEQVWPREVEEIIAAHPKVSEVSVAGVPDPILGEVVKAWVVVKPGESLSTSEVQEWCSKSLARYKIPRQVEFRTGLPKTTVGKVLRRELVRQHMELAN